MSKIHVHNMKLYQRTEIKSRQIENISHKIVDRRKIDRAVMKFSTCLKHQIMKKQKNILSYIVNIKSFKMHRFSRNAR